MEKYSYNVSWKKVYSKKIKAKTINLFLLENRWNKNAYIFVNIFKLRRPKDYNQYGSL